MTESTIVKQTVLNLEEIAADPAQTKAFITELTRYEHRTHQQRIAKLLVRVFEEHANQGAQGNFDGRNEATVRWAMKLKDAGLFAEAIFPFI